MSARADGSRLPRSGSLRELPFERLLFGAFLEERTLALVLRRLQVEKTLWIDRGAPTECVSNLKHETLGQFLLSRGRITNAEFKDCLSEAACREVRIGEIIVERGLLAPGELGEALRQNLAYKLLDCFTWTDGEFRVEAWLPDETDAPAIRTPRVVFTGITKFVPQDRVAAALGPLLERPLTLASQTRVALDELRMSAMQHELIRKLRRPTDAHTLFQRGKAGRDELARTLYACSVLGLVAAVEPVATARPAGDVDEEETIAIEVDVSGLPEEAPWSFRDEIAAEYRALDDRSPVAFFGIPAEAPPAAVRARYVELCRRYAPERFESAELAPVAEMAAELLHAATSAYEALRRRRAPPQATAAQTPRRDAGVSAPAPQAESAPDPRGMSGDYARQARERMAGGNFGAAAGLLTLALRSDPGNVACRVQLAYARFRESPDRAAESLQELEEVLVGAPHDALAHLFAAEISHALEDPSAAVRHFERGCALWEEDAA